MHLVMNAMRLRHFGLWSAMILLVLGLGTLVGRALDPPARRAVATPAASPAAGPSAAASAPERSVTDPIPTTLPACQQELVAYKRAILELQTQLIEARQQLFVAQREAALAAVAAQEQTVRHPTER